MIMAKAMILMEEASTSYGHPEESICRLLAIHGFAESAVDRQCVAWGQGIHVKHEIMDGIHSFFSDRIPEGAKVLDVGCGIGALAGAIAQSTGACITGIDFNQAQIDFARAHFNRPNLTFKVGDATKDLPDGGVDVIVLSSVLEHIVDRKALLGALIAKYRPAKLLIRVPMLQRHFHVALKQKLKLFAYTDPDHKTEYTERQLREELTGAGLSVDYLEVRWGDYWVECGASEPVS